MTIWRGHGGGGRLSVDVLDDYDPDKGTVQVGAWTYALSPAERDVANHLRQMALDLGEDHREAFDG